MGLVRIQAGYFVIPVRYKLLITARGANTKSDSFGLTDCGAMSKKVLNLVQRFLDDPTLWITNKFAFK